jgi:exopolysaccharide biosynthesis polyprenyl glycosylphosphotransferase
MPNARQQGNTMSQTTMRPIAMPANPLLLPGHHAVPLAAETNRDSRFADAMRRVRDVAGSLALLLLTLPLLVLVACLIKLDSPGPVLYRQERVGLNGRVFTLLKFRSMRIDAEAAGPRWAAQRDPRVTRVGAFIRACRIDELPQLLNVLRGEMSLVGPRPERLYFAEQLARIIPCYNERTRVPPGITGWAQVNYPYGASVQDARAKLEFDLYYTNNRSLNLDLRIMLATVRVMALGTGAR